MHGADIEHVGMRCLRGRGVDSCTESICCWSTTQGSRISLAVLMYVIAHVDVLVEFGSTLDLFSMARSRLFLLDESGLFYFLYACPAAARDG